MADEPFTEILRPAPALCCCVAAKSAWLVVDTRGKVRPSPLQMVFGYVLAWPVPAPNTHTENRAGISLRQVRRRAWVRSSCQGLIGGQTSEDCRNNPPEFT